MEINAEQQSEIDALCRHDVVRGLRIFGSAAVGSEPTDSNVDLLVQFTPGPASSAFELVDLRDAL